MATFTSKFDIGDLVYLRRQASYYQNTDMYRVATVTFSFEETTYTVKLADKANSGSLIVEEEDLAFSQE